jgi:hypothetical protein
VCKKFIIAFFKAHLHASEEHPISKGRKHVHSQIAKALAEYFCGYDEYISMVFIFSGGILYFIFPSSSSSKTLYPHLAPHVVASTNKHWRM